MTESLPHITVSDEELVPDSTSPTMPEFPSGTEEGAEHTLARESETQGIDAPADDVIPAYADSTAFSRTAAANEDDPISPSTTAEIDVDAVVAQLGDDPGSTQSFPPISAEELIDADCTYDAGTTTSLMWGARSDVGCVRSHNEDSYLAQSPLFAVCDGMGGHAAGEVASSIAVETIARCAPHAADPTALGAAVEAANAAVIEAAERGLGKPGMGCTATCAYVEHTIVAIAHVGDSRAYLLHEGTLIRLTHDHSYVEELIDAGEITPDEARIHPNRSVITRALGSDPNMYADHFQINIETGDRLILCSDGLSSMVDDGEMERIATQSSTAQICTDNLVDAALAAGGADNVSVVVIDLLDDGRLKEAAQHRRRRLAWGAGILAGVMMLGAILAYISITNSFYLGIKDDVVAIYKGVPSSFMGFELHWLQDETTIHLEDLPEDTQKRLEEGISQSSLNEAIETVSKYRKQIYEQQTQLIEHSDDTTDATSDLNGSEEISEVPSTTGADTATTDQSSTSGGDVS